MGITMNRRQQQAYRELRSLFNYATRTQVEDEDLEQYGIPTSFRPRLRELCRQIRATYKTGDHAGAREHAHDAAMIGAETFGEELRPRHGDPAKLAAEALGELTATDQELDENDPAALAKQVPRGFS